MSHDSANGSWARIYACGIQRCEPHACNFPQVQICACKVGAVQGTPNTRGLRSEKPNKRSTKYMHTYMYSCRPPSCSCTANLPVHAAEGSNLWVVGEVPPNRAPQYPHTCCIGVVHEWCSRDAHCQAMQQGGRLPWTLLLDCQGPGT